MLTQFWRASLTGQAWSRLFYWVESSLTARGLKGAAALAAVWSRGSLAGRFLERDLGGSRLLAGSRTVSWLYALGRRLERTVQTLGRALAAAVPVSLLGQAVGRFAWSAERRAGAFLAGGALGLALGVVLLGLALGGLTPKRLMVAAALVPVSAFLYLLPGRLQDWLESSLVVRLARWLLNLGAA